MARKGDGIYLRGKTWWMDVRVHGKRHQKALGKNIKRAVAVEFASLERAKILRGEAGIGQKKRPDMPFERAADEFLAWVKANKRANTHTSYQQCLAQLKTSFVGKTLGEIHPFLIEKHKQRRLSEGVKVSVNREITCLKTLFYRMIDWKKFEGENPAR